MSNEIVKKTKEARKVLEETKNRKAEFNGRLNQLTEQLANDYQLANVEEARKHIDSLNETLTDEQEKLDDLMEELDEMLEQMQDESSTA